MLERWVSYLWYPGLKSPACEGPGMDNDISWGHFRVGCDWFSGGKEGVDELECAGVFLGSSTGGTVGLLRLHEGNSPVVE